MEDAALGKVSKKSAEFSALFKTHPPHLQSAEKNKKKHGLKIILSKNNHFGKKLFFPIGKVQKNSRSGRCSSILTLSLW